MDSKDKVALHAKLCNQLNDIYERKNHDYGDSFHTTFLEEGMAMARIRLGDKYRRFCVLSKASEGRLVKDESIRDTLLDMANYAIMTVIEMDLQKSEEDNTYDPLEKLRNAPALKTEQILRGIILDIDHVDDTIY